jgi:hypothetical protein
MSARLRYAWLGALALAFLVGLVAGLPATIALRAAPPELRARLSDVEGSVWHGRARLVLAAAPAAVEWRLAPSSLLRAAPRFGIVLDHPRAHLRGDLTLAGGRLELSAGELRTSLAPLADVAGLPAGALLGSVDAQGIEATLDAEGLRHLACSGAITGLTAAGAAAPIALGDLALACDDDTGGPTIALDDRGGPLELKARIAFAPGWRYLVEGTAGARAGAAPEIAQALPLLGQAEGPDRVRFRYSGEITPR